MARDIAAIRQESPGGSRWTIKKGGSRCPCDYKDNGNGGKRPPRFIGGGSKNFSDPSHATPFPPLFINHFRKETI